MNVMVVSQKASVIFLTLILSYTCDFIVMSMEVRNENTTTLKVSVENNHRFSQKNKHSSFLKHHKASIKIPTNKEISAAPDIVEFMKESRNHSFITSIIQMDKAIDKPGLKNKSVLRPCSAQYLCGTSTVTSFKGYLMCRNGTEICTRIPYILKHLGSYTCGYCNQPQQSQFQTARALQKSLDCSPLPGAILKTTKELHYQGENVTLLFSHSGDYLFISLWLKIVYANVTIGYSYAETISATSICSYCYSINGKESMYIDWKPGKYKAVIYDRLGPVVAVSQTFTVLKQNGNIMSSSETYSHGETSYLIAVGFSLPLREEDVIRIIPANVSKNFHLAPYATKSKVGEFSGSRNSVVPFYANWTVGQYKAVLFLKESKVVLAVSNVFKLTKLSVVVSTSKRTYFQGEDIVVTLNDTRGVPLRKHDQVRIVDSSKFIFDKSLNEASGLPLVNVYFYINKAVAVRRYRAVFMLGNSDMRVMSQVFEVKENQIELNSTQTTYYQGDGIRINFKSLSGVRFFNNDEVRIIPADIASDYSNAPYADSYNAYYANGLSSYNWTFYIDEMVIGKYKAVLLLEDNTYFVVSNVFEILQNIVHLNSSKTTYKRSEPVVIRFSSISGVPFRYYDMIYIFPLPMNFNCLSFIPGRSYVFRDYIGDASGLTSGNISIPINWNHYNDGKYKAVFAFEYIDRCAAVSDEFNIPF